MTAGEFCLRMGDNALILSHRLSEWCGHAPALEEDIASANTALDLIGQARLWLTLAGERRGRAEGADDLAYLRDVGEFRNVLLVEQPNGDYAQTLTRQFLFDAWHYIVLEQLAAAEDAAVCDIAQKAVKEVAYHRHRSTDLLVRLGDGSDESHRRMQSALDWLWPFTGELFDEDDTDKQFRAASGGLDYVRLRTQWNEYVDDTLSAATLSTPDGDWFQQGGKRGIHSEHLGYLLADMQFLQRAYPGAQW